jgi:hypothetical protein
VESNSSHFLFDRLTIYSNPGNGIVLNENTHHWGIVNSKVELRPGTNRRITIAAGAVDVRNSKGYGMIKNSKFSFNGDDFINFHDNTSFGLARVDANTIYANATNWKVQYNVGDVIEFLNPNYSPTGFSSKITHLSYDSSKQRYTLKFADPIPAEVSDDSLLADKSYDGSNYVIRNNTFYGTRVRGILSQVGNGLIEYNTFSHTRAAAIQLNATYEKRWSEGRGTSNTMIRHNVFDTCNVMDMNDQFGKGTVYVGSFMNGKGTTEYPLHQHILIEKNVFKDQPGRSMTIASSERVTIKDNRIMDPTPRMNNKPERGKIWVEKSSDVDIEDNVWEQSANAAGYGVDFDSTTVSGLMDHNNTTTLHVISERSQ